MAAALQLTEPGHHIGHRLTGRGGGVDALVRGHQSPALTLGAVEQANGVNRRLPGDPEVVGSGGLSSVTKIDYVSFHNGLEAVANLLEAVARASSRPGRTPVVPAERKGRWHMRHHRLG